MDFKHVKNYSKQNKEADLLLYSEIRDGDGYYIANEINYLIREGVEKINLRINSPGGSIREGYSVFSAILNCEGYCEINTYNDGLAASMSGVILMAGKKRYMKDYATLMLHNPHFGNPDASYTKQEKKVIDVFKKSITTMFVRNTSLTEEQVMEIMNQDTWYDSSQALELGFIDEIQQSNIARPLIQNKDTKLIYEAYNSIIISTNKEPILKMENTLNPDLAIALSATNVAEAMTNLSKMKAQIEALKTSKENLEAQNSELVTKIEKHESEKQAMQKSQAENLVNTAIKEQRINASQKETWVQLAVQNYEGAKAAIDSIQPTKLTNIIEANIKNSKDDDSRSNWTYMDYAKNAPKELARIKSEQPELFDEIKNRLK